MKVNANHLCNNYDLHPLNEDPRILQDVQRALKLKARREARLGSNFSALNSEKVSSRLQRNISLLGQSPTQLGSLSSELDFSPSTGGSFLHPVPASLDNGATLDWSSSDDKPESRWKLTGSKRKGKETLLPLSMIIDKQETVHAGES